MNKKNHTWKDVKRFIANMEASQLCGILQDLYKFNDENKAFFHSRFLSDQTNSVHLEHYKARISKAICPKEPWKRDVQLSAGHKAISEFKKANGNFRDTLSLMFFYVACGNDFTLQFGDIDESFYRSMESMFARLVERKVSAIPLV